MVPPETPPRIADRINAERLVLLGWSRAILLQLAHPLVAAGVAAHSGFRSSPLASARRLHQTVRAMRSLTFGDAREQSRAIDGILAIHRRIHGTLREQVGGFPAGTPYSAEDPALLLWVHATLIESSVLVYERLVAPVMPVERDEYCREAAPVAVALGAHEDAVPADWAALTRYMESMSSSGALAVGQDARGVADAVLSGAFSRIAAPMAWVNRRLTAGWLPAWARAEYGIRWTAREARQCASLEAAIRRSRRLWPDALARWPEARARTRIR